MNPDFGLAQIFPIADETTAAEPKIDSASFADPYVLLLRDDGRITVLRADESGDIDEVEQGASSREKAFEVDLYTRIRPTFSDWSQQ